MGRTGGDWEIGTQGELQGIPPTQTLKHSPTPPLILLPLTLGLILGLFGCSSQTHKATQPSASSSPTQDSESNLTFFGVNFEQADEAGRPVWRVKAKKAKYFKEKQIGQAESPSGELYQDGKVVYEFTAQQADIKQDGKQLFLKGKIVAVDPHNGVVVRGNELEWRPKEDLMIVRNQVTGNNKQLQVVAKEGRVKTREQRMDLFGDVVANSNEPQLQMRTQHLIWQIKQQKLIGDRPVQIDRYENNQITDRGKGDTAEANLKTKIITVKNNAQIEILNPAMQVTSNFMTWDLNAETVKTSAPVRVFHRTDNVTVNGDRGEMNTQQKIVYITGNVNAVGQRGQLLKSKKLTWYLNNQFVEAQGNVFYQQMDPPLSFTGQQASGNLQDENIVVKGNNSSDKVYTKIIPQDLKSQ
ncbi:MAG: LPS export ABC transporter periplasmic protein LptC [Rhizonema sp. NSF051]|nr:LPS export ABC transporter periplasmic protein LptC [Rhizonema sp. NSF051]